MSSMQITLFNGHSSGLGVCKAVLSVFHYSRKQLSGKHYWGSVKTAQRKNKIFVSPFHGFLLNKLFWYLSVWINHMSSCKGKYADYTEKVVKTHNWRVCFNNLIQCTCFIFASGSIKWFLKFLINLLTNSQEL